MQQEQNTNNTHQVLMFWRFSGNAREYVCPGTLTRTAQLFPP